MIEILNFMRICIMFIITKNNNKMARNKPYGDNTRKGAVKGRSQTFNTKTNQYVKRNAETGKFMDVKQNGTPLKGVRKENK